MKIVNLHTTEQRQPYIAPVYDLLASAYAPVPGGLHFSSAMDLFHSTCRWDIGLVDGRVVAVIVYKRRHGLKISAFARHADGVLRDKGRHVLKDMISERLRYAWVEVSDHAESFVLNECDGRARIVSNAKVGALLSKDIELVADGIHYRRTILGCNKSKLVVGSPQWGSLAA